MVASGKGLLHPFWRNALIMCRCRFFQVWQNIFICPRIRTFQSSWWVPEPAWRRSARICRSAGRPEQRERTGSFSGRSIKGAILPTARNSTLRKIVQEQGGKSVDQANEYVEKLKSDKRYKRDVY